MQSPKPFSIEILITGHFQATVSGDRRIRIPKTQFLIREHSKVRVYIEVIEEPKSEDKPASSVTTDKS